MKAFQNELACIGLGLLVMILCTTCQKSDSGDSGIDPTTITGSENLGSGYDVFETYADVYKVKAAILDIGKLADDGKIEVKNVEHGYFTTTSGASVDAYSTSLSAMASLSGSYMYFSGAIKSNFHKERYSYESYSFATVNSLIQKTQLRVPLDMTAEDLKPYLSGTARAKLNDPAITPQYIFNTYGTHCITGIILGGRLDYNVSARTSDLTVGKSIGVYAEASFASGGVSVEGSTGVVSTEEYNTFMNSCQKILHVYGGQSEFGQDIINKDDYDAWINSIQDDPVFCNFTQNGLIPVWEFCDSQSRKEELMAAFETWAADRKIQVNPAPRLCILDVKVLFGHNAADPFVENGRIYHRLNADLNVGCGGSTEYVWIYYLLDYENDTTFTPLAEICTVNTTDGEALASLPGPGWELVPGDLNKSAGGDYILLAVRRASASEALMTGLHVEFADTQAHFYSLNTGMPNFWYPVMQGYYGPSKQDLNEDAGGYFVYLYYTRDNINSR